MILQGLGRIRRKQVLHPLLAGIIENDRIIIIMGFEAGGNHGSSIHTPPALPGIERMAKHSAVGIEVPCQVVGHRQVGRLDQRRAGINAEADCGNTR